MTTNEIRSALTKTRSQFGIMQSGLHKDIGLRRLRDGFDALNYGNEKRALEMLNIARNHLGFVERKSA